LAVRDGARSWRAVLVAVVVVTLVQAAFVVGIVGFLRQRVIVTATGLIVKNVIHTNTITWSELGGLSAQIIISSVWGPWQGVVALLAGSDRAVGLMATATRRPERCQHYLAQLRTLAPPNALTADTLAHTPAPAVLRPAHAPGRRLVVRSHTLTGSMSVTFVLWLGVALVPVIVSVALLV